MDVTQSIMEGVACPFYSCSAMKDSVVVPVLSVSLLCVFALLTSFMSGCDLAKPQNQHERRQPAGVEGAGIADVPKDPPAQQESAPKEDDTVTVKAEPGLTGKGNYSSAGDTSNPMSIISTPVSQYFRVQDRIILQQVEAAMNLYKGEHGRLPTTHEEFVIDIIQANNIVLPRLPEGHTYVYDPADGVLKVRKPRNTP